MEMVGLLNSQAGLAVDLVVFAGLLATCATVAWATLAGARWARLDRLLAPKRGASIVSLVLSGTGVVAGLGALGLMLGVIPETLVPHGWAGSATCGAALASFVLIGTSAARPVTPSAQRPESTPATPSINHVGTTRRAA